MFKKSVILSKKKPKMNKKEEKSVSNPTCYNPKFEYLLNQLNEEKNPS